jgi:hypothetical protein
MPASQEIAEQSLVGIVEAARHVQLLANARPAAREIAFNEVLDASSGASVAARFFSVTTFEKPRDVESDWFSNAAAASLELRSAGVLTGVAAVRGEIQLPSGIDSDSFLSEAISHADIELKGLRTIDPRMHFSSITQEEVASPDLNSAIGAFRNAATSTVSAIVDNSEKVVSAAFDAIGKHGGEILSAFRSIAELTSWGDTLTGFVSRAWEKIKSALTFLKQLSDSIQSQDLHDKLAKLRDLPTVRNGLEWIYSVSQTKSAITSLALRPGITIPDIDLSKLELVRLDARFSAFSKTLKSILVGISIAGLLSAHFSGSTGLLIIPVGNALVTAVVITAGLDFLGDVQLTKNVRGVKQVAENLATSRASE